MSGTNLQTASDPGLSEFVNGKQASMTGGVTSYLDRMLAGEERENLIERIDRQRARMYELTGSAFEAAERDLKVMAAELEVLR